MIAVFRFRCVVILGRVETQLLTTACCVCFPPPPSGDTHLGGGLDTNGSTESFELVTEENNGDGNKSKTDGRGGVT